MKEFTRSPFHSRLGQALTALAASAMFMACMHDASEDVEPKAVDSAERRLFVFTTTYAGASKGVLLSVDPDSMKRGPDSLAIYNDSRTFVKGGSVYVLERFGADNLLKYDPVSRTVVYQEHLGDGANPSDLVFRDDGTAVVSLSDAEGLVVVDTATGAIKSRVDLSAYAHVPDSATSGAKYSPHAFAIALAGDTLLVALQRRNADWMLDGHPAAIVLLNAKTLTVLDTLQAPALNGAAMWVDEEAIYFACPGRYDSLDGGLYRWKRGTGAFKTVFTETALGGNVNDIACNEAGLCLVSAYGLDFSESLRSFSLDDGRINEALTGFTRPVGGLLWDAKQKVFFVGERNTVASGLVRLGSDLKPVGDLLPLGIPPANFALYEKTAP